jgi:hypothetical protein
MQTDKICFGKEYMLLHTHSQFFRGFGQARCFRRRRGGGVVASTDGEKIST